MTSWPAERFERFYADPDPYGFADSWYEQRKYALTLAVLRSRRYAHALEIGCSEGLFTGMLAGRCDRVTAIDAAPTAVDRARQRLRDRPYVDVRRARVPDELPDGPFDLVVFSEVGYFLTGDDLAGLLDGLERVTTATAELAAVHWRHPSDDLPQDGDEVHRSLRTRHAWTSVVRHAEPDFLVDVLLRGRLSD